MSEPTRQYRAFLLKQFAEVSWNAEDVQTLRPYWSEEQCNDMLKQEEDNIQTSMIDHGWSVLKSKVIVYEYLNSIKENE